MRNNIDEDFNKASNPLEKSGSFNFGPDHLPASLLCPITQDVIQEPVLAADGYRYERAALQEWLDKHHTSPVTRQPMDMPSLPDRGYEDTTKAYENVVRSEYRAKKEQRRIEEEKKKEEERRKKAEEKAHRKKDKNDSLKEDMKAMRESMDRMEAMMMEVTRTNKGLKEAIETDSENRALDYQRNYRKTKKKIASRTAKKAVTQIVVGGVVTTAAVVTGLAIAEGVILGGLVGGGALASTGAVCTGVFCTAMAAIPIAGWIVLAVVGTTAIVAIVAGPTIYRYIMDKDNPKDPKTVARVVDNLVGNQEQRLTVTEFGNRLAEFKFRFVATLKAIYYSLSELASRVAVLMTRWSMDTSETALTRKSYLDSALDNTVAHLTVSVRNTNPELEQIAERIEHIKMNGDLPTSEDVGGPYILNDSVIQDANNNPEYEDPSSTSIVKSITTKIATSTVQLASTSLTAGIYTLDNTQVVKLGRVLEGGCFATQEIHKKEMERGFKDLQ